MERLKWPDGNKAAASFTFDFDAESAWIGMDTIYEGRPGALSQGSFGARVGLPLVLEVLADHGVRASFFIPGVNVERYPELVEEVIASGHEVAMHGYTHTAPSLLTPAQEQEELGRAYDLLTAAGGTVSGYRSPSWDVSPVTLDLLEEKGLRYASQFMDDIVPYRHRGRRLLELPIQWVLDDWPHFAWYPADSARTIQSTTQVEAIWLEEFKAIHRLGGAYILTMHPQIIGRPSRIELLDRFMEYVLSCDDVWTTTCDRIATHAEKVLPLDNESQSNVE